MNTTPSTADIPSDLELPPSYGIPLVAIAVGIPLTLIFAWVGVPIVLFGIFLLIQTALIRLKFTATSLEVYRSGKLIRNFPYHEWEDWQIFWQPIPILFYFKEVNSIHFLPIIFDPKLLRERLPDRSSFR
jgi:hypothetical protein